MPCLQPADFDTMADELARDEGIRRTVYDDATGEPIRPGTTVHGHPTIAIGRSLDIDGLSITEAKSLVMNDIASYLPQLKPLSWFSGMDAVRQRAILNMRHQLGLAGLLAFRDLIRYCDAHDYASAARAGRESFWARSQTPDRAARVLEQLASGIAIPCPILPP
jgi:lysozyme